MRYVALLFAVLCLLAPSTAAVAAATPPTSPVGAADPAALDGTNAPALASFGSPSTEFVVSVHANRSARWTVTATFPFETQADRAAFLTYADRYEAGEAVGGPSAMVFRNAAARASNATGREMAIRDVNRTARLVNQTAGVLRLSFTWTGFVGRSETGQLVLADVFRTADNTTWFRTLRSGHRLVIEPPTGYAITDAPVGIRGGRAVISGPTTLDPDELAIRFSPTQVTSTPPGDWSTGEVLLAVLVGGFLVGGAAVLFYRHGVDGADDGRAPAVGAGGDGPQPTDGGTTAPSDGDAGAPTPGTAEADAAGEEAEEDVELLSDEERVERLLARNGGRMRQAAIVQETGWSDAKVSQLLSAMADDERVEKLRLGRENLISLPDEGGEGGGDGAGGIDGA